MGYLGRKSMEILGNRSSFAYNMIFPKQHAKARYVGDKLVIGWMKNGSEKFDFSIDLGESTRALIIGPTGSGKTFLMEGMICRLYKHGIANVIFDAKGSFNSLANSINYKFSDNLRYGETPESLPIKVIRPSFLKKRPNTIRYQIQMSELTLNDLITLFTAEDSQAQIDCLSDLYSMIADGEITDIKEMEESLENLKDTETRTKKSIRQRIRLMKSMHIIGNKHVVDIVDLINNNYQIVIDYSGMRENENYSQCDIAILLRRIFKAKEEGRIEKKIFIHIDETPRFYPSIGNPVSKHEITELIDLGREFGISMSFASQDRTNIGDKVYSQSRYLFLSYKANRDEIESILKDKSMYVFSPRESKRLKAEIGRFMKRYRGGARSWMCIDSDLKERFYFLPYAPFAGHKEEK